LTPKKPNALYGTGTYPWPLEKWSLLVLDIQEKSIDLYF